MAFNVPQSASVGGGLGPIVINQGQPQRKGIGQVLSAVAPALGPIGSIIGGLLGSKGTKAANAAQIAAAREQMDFQERMSSTAYQRAADDLEAAGLNRVLALGSPASSPGGAMPNISNELQGLASGVSAAAHSAADLATKRENIRLIKSQRAAADEAANVSYEQAETIRQQGLNTAQQVRINKVEADFSEEFHSYLKSLEAAGKGLGVTGDLIKIFNQFMRQRK